MGNYVFRGMKKEDRKAPDPKDRKTEGSESPDPKRLTVKNTQVCCESLGTDFIHTAGCSSFAAAPTAASVK